MKNKLKVSKTKIKKLFKNHIKLIIGFLIGISITGGVYAEIKILSEEVYYDNTASGLSSDDVQGAIDELKGMAKVCDRGPNTPLKVGDYFSLTPDKSSYTIPGSGTGHLGEGAPWNEYKNSHKVSWNNNSYYCCTTEKPTISISTGEYSIEGTYTKGSNIKNKYCLHAPHATTGSCSGGNTEIYSPSANATSTSTSITTSYFTGSGTMIPDNQTTKPSELTLWRVIEIQSDGSVDAVSEYVSSMTVEFKGVTGYANFIGTLQNIANQYTKAGYTTSARMMGYDGQVLNIFDNSKFNGSSSTLSGISSTGAPIIGDGEEYNKGVGGDTFYLHDYQLVSNVYKKDNNATNYCASGICAYKTGTTVKTSYYVASRQFTYTDSDSGNFLGRYIDANGSIAGSNLRIINNGKWSDKSSSYSVRPIITLKEGIRTSEGTGTKSSPYKLTNS